MSVNFRANLFLIIASLIWGSTYVFQREAMHHVSPFAFNAFRFLLGSFMLLPFAFKNYKKLILQSKNKNKENRNFAKASLYCGLLLFLGITFQQYGLVYTDSGKAAFITSLYVVIVPVLCIFLGQKIQHSVFIGIVVALIGFYFLSIDKNFTLTLGDALILIGAFFWAFHFLAIASYVNEVGAVILTAMQSLICGFLSLIMALFLGQMPSLTALNSVLLHIFWAGILAVALAYLLQMFAQKHAQPIAAAVVLQTESVFAVIFGYVFLKEVLTGRMVLGSALILLGILISQIILIKFKNK